MTGNGRLEEMAVRKESVLSSSSVSHLIPVPGSTVTHLSLASHLVDDVTRDSSAHTKGAECPCTSIDHTLFATQHFLQQRRYSMGKDDGLNCVRRACRKEQERGREVGLGGRRNLREGGREGERGGGMWEEGGGSVEGGSENGEGVEREED